MAKCSRSRPGVQTASFYGDVARAAKLEGRLRFFGHNAPANVNVYLPPPNPTPWPKWVISPSMPRSP